MKVLITTDWYSPMVNGVVASVLNLQSELTKLGHDVRVLTLSDNYHNQVKNNIYYVGSLNVGKIYPNARFKMAPATKMINQLSEWEPDVIHSQCEFSTFMLAKRISNRTGAPIIHTYHTVYEDYTHYFSPNKRWGKAVVSSFSRVALKKVAAVIVPTKKVKDILEEYHVSPDIRVVPTGIDLHKYQAKVSEEIKNELKEKHGVPEGNKVLVYIGRIAKEKNLEEIIIFFEKVNMPKATLLIVGDGPHRETLEKFAKNTKVSDRIIFTGMIDPDIIHKYYQLGDVFVTASNSETQGLTYIESLASGVAVLCKRDKCVEDVVINDENGWQYEGYQDFEKHLVQILNDDKLKEQLGKNGKEIAFANFSKQQFAKSVEQVYKEAINA